MTAPTLERPTSQPGPRFIAAAEELVPLLKSQARAIEEARELTPAVLSALHERGLLQAILSPARGEGEFTITDAMNVLETLATGDASTAWDTMAAMGGGIISAFLPKDPFTSPTDCAATAVGRLGKATAVEGGYLVDAKWPFLSGSPHATWIGGLCIVHDGEQPRFMAEGEPHVIMPLIRKERVQLLGNWDATGLKGTGSQEAEVHGVFVPHDEVADFMNGPRPGLPLLYSIHEDAVAPLVAAAVLVGVGRAAVEEFRSLQASRLHQSGVMGSQAPLPQVALAECEGRLELARAGIYAVASAIDAKHASGQPAGPEDTPRTSLAATAAAELTIEVVSKLYRAAGSSAVLTGSVLDRALRDAFTLGAHRMLQRENYLIHGAGRFG